MKRGQGEDSSIGIIEPERRSDVDVDQLVRSIEDAGAEAIRGEPDEVLAKDPMSVCAVGEAALCSIANATPDVPILPVAAGRAVRSVPEDAFSEAFKALTEGPFETVDRNRYEVLVDGQRAGTALFDMMLVTTDPARISEYSLEVRERHVARFRADGIVVATPTGSQGYAADAGGPVLSPDAGTVAVPVAQFATDRDSWVFAPEEELTLRIERNEGPVELLIDEKRHGVVAPGDTVSLSPATPIQLVVVPQSAPYWPTERLEKL